MIEESLDIDWFAVDQRNNILHFASGGGRLPQTIKEAVEENDYLNAFIRGLPELSIGVEVSAELSKYVNLENDQSRHSYLHDFTFMARKGLFSFDKSYLGQPLNHVYHLVCIPRAKLFLLDLPTEIQTKFLKTRIHIDAEQTRVVDLSTLIG